MKRVTSALGMTCLMIPVTVLLRLLTVARYSDTSLNWFSYGVALFLTLAAAVLLLSGVGKKQPAPCPEGHMAMLISVLVIISGAALTLHSLADLFGWLADGTIPAPVNFNISPADRLLLIFLLFFGITGGMYLLYVGYRWLRDKSCRPVKPGLPALLPVLWAWFRLARYTVSYVSAAGLGETIYDYGWLIFSLLFLLKLSQFTAGRRSLTCCDLITAMLPAAWFGIAGCLSTLTVSCLPASLLRNPVRAGSIANWSDLPLAVLALLLAADALWKYRHVPGSPETEPETEPPCTPTSSEKKSDDETTDPFKSATSFAANYADTTESAEPSPDKPISHEDASPKKTGFSLDAISPEEERQALDALLKEFSSTNPSETTTDQ